MGLFSVPGARRCSIRFAMALDMDQAGQLYAAASSWLETDSAPGAGKGKRMSMNIAFVVHTEHYAERVLKLLHVAGIDYFTRWDNAIGKGQGTEPHLGRGTYASTNSVMMIAFRDEAPLEVLIQKITAENAAIKRPSDRIRLFQVPLERIL
jgi:hypothetical protein